MFWLDFVLRVSSSGCLVHQHRLHHFQTALSCIHERALYKSSTSSWRTHLIIYYNFPFYHDMLIDSVIIKDVGSLWLFSIIFLSNHISITSRVILCTKNLSFIIYWVNEDEEFLPTSPPFHMFNRGPALIISTSVLLHFISLNNHQSYFAFWMFLSFIKTEMK